MEKELKALVFKTSKFDATIDFFQNLIGLHLKEVSNKHFVIHKKGIRIVFIEANDDGLGAEFYIKGKNISHINLAELSDTKVSSFSNYIDPNGISVLLCHNIDSTK